MEVSLGQNSRIVELTPSMIISSAGPLMAELLEREQTFGYSVRSDWSWKRKPNFNLHQIFRLSFTVPAVLDTAEGWHAAFQKALRDILADAEWVIQHGVRAVSDEGAYPVCLMGGYEDEKIPELTRETAVIRWLREPRMMPESRSTELLRENPLPPVQALLMEFTLLPFHGKPIKSETVDRITA